MILVDTSVWIDYLRSKSNPKSDQLDRILDLKIPFGITGQIYQEVLQGVSTGKDFNSLKIYFSTFTIYSPLDERESYLQAAHIFFLCRKRGVTVRSSIDCLIVQIAREHHLKLLHHDKDFDYICKVVGGVEVL